MVVASFALFETALGPCAVAWTARGISRLWLPEVSLKVLRAQVEQQFPHAEEKGAPRAIQGVIKQVQKLLGGQNVDFSGAQLDWEAVSDFSRQVYEAARAIPHGETRSYIEVARAIGRPKGARAVGQALGRNPFAPIVPCHRVLASGAKMGGFSAPGGVETKCRMLEIEGVLLSGTSAPALGATEAQLKLPQLDGNASAKRHSKAEIASERKAAGKMVSARSAAESRQLVTAFTPETKAAGDAPTQQTASDPLSHLAQVDATLGRFITEHGPFALERSVSASAFEALARAIVFQQLTGKAAGTIWARLEALYPDSRVTPQGILETTLEALRAVGLSGSKSASVRDLAEKALSGVVPELAELESLSDDDIVARLTAVRGVGRWTVEMLLIFRLGRLDVLPCDDYGVRKGYATLFKQELPSAKQLKELGKHWAPFRSVASWYLWRAADGVRLSLPAKNAKRAKKKVAQAAAKAKPSVKAVEAVARPKDKPSVKAVKAVARLKHKPSVKIAKAVARPKVKVAKAAKKQTKRAKNAKKTPKNVGNRRARKS